MVQGAAGELGSQWTRQKGQWAQDSHSGQVLQWHPGGHRRDTEELAWWLQTVAVKAGRQLRVSAGGHQRLSGL